MAKKRRLAPKQPASGHARGIAGTSSTAVHAHPSDLPIKDGKALEFLIGPEVILTGLLIEGYMFAHDNDRHAHM